MILTSLIRQGYGRASTPDGQFTDYMNKIPPFIPNSDDGIHCVNAVFRMIAKHYFDKDYTWDEIDALTQAIPGKATWTLVGATEFSKLGLKVQSVEAVEYEKMYRDGPGYLAKTLGKAAADYYLQKSNIASVIKYIPEFLEHVPHETRKASVEEIVGHLKQGNLLGVEVNSSILNDKLGFSLHFVLLYDFDGTNIVLHDPGLPPLEARKVPLDQFKAAYDYKGANGEVLIFSR